jgi:hypothetical protein
LRELAGRAVTNTAAQAKTDFYPALVLYGEGDAAEDTEGGDAQLRIARMLPFLQRLSGFVRRINLVVKTVVHQLASLHSSRPAAQCIDPTDVHLESVFSGLGRCFTILVTLDEIIMKNELLEEHWKLCVPP